MKYAKKTQGSAVAGVVLTIILVLAAFIGGTWLGAEVLSADRDSEIEAVSGETENGTASDETQSQNTPAAEDTAVMVGDNTVYQLSGEDVAVPTPYCTLYYPALFEEFLRIKHEFSSELYAVHFNANFGEGSTSNLFSVYFAKDDGRQPDGIVVGGVRDENGDVMMVIVVINSELPKSDWSQDTSNLVYAMQEGISYCMEKITQLDNVILDR